MTDRTAASTGQVSFGPFRLLPAQQLLLEGEKPVRLGSRARDILVTLVERPGELVSKQELIARVWPNTFVEEGNLKVHVAALRRALGDGHAGRRFIANIPGRGYSFVAPVARAEGEKMEAAPPIAVERPPDLPPPLSRMVGRSDIVLTLATQLPRHRFITLVGPGGIGKTTVALAVADSLISTFRDGVHFVDLAPLTDPLLVPSALASVLGIAVRSENPVRGLISFLKDRQMLVVLDSCEHVIEAAAALAEEIFNGARRMHILATSREPLRAEGERVHRLSPLGSPPASAELTAAHALTFPAVQLFVERAAASLDAFELNDADAPIVADICRRLDGIALAIELAAGRADAFGVAGLAAHLDDRFRLLMRGRRTALPRHQTLSTTLDWSYVLLPEVERVVLRRLAIFAGIFTMESASAVLAGDDMSASDVVDCVANLIAKSLVAAGVEGTIAHYRLLDTTRAYALVKLDESGEREPFVRRHAEHYRDLLEQADTEWRTRPATQWLDHHRHLIDNVRVALDWSYSAGGDAATGVALTVAAVPLWFQLSLMSECSERVQRALSGPAPSRSAEQEMRLHAALAWSLMQTRGQVAETRAAWTKVLEIAEAIDDVDYQLRALWGLWSGRLNDGEFRAALALAQRFSLLAARQADPTDGLVGDRMIGYILHLLGDQTGARLHIERMLSRYEVPVIGAQIIRFIFDQRATARCFLARILWLQGFPDQAMATAESIVEGALASDDTLSLCQALVQAACPVALLVGNLERAERFVTMLLDYSTRNALEFWGAWGRCFKGVLCVRLGNLSEGLHLLGAALGELREIQFGVYYVVFLGEFAEALGRAGRAAQGLAAVDEALARSERNEGLWYVAELLRIKGELTLLAAAPKGAVEAEALFLQSLDWARRQETSSWELRTAISLSRLWRDQHRPAEARDLITPIYGRFAEGLGTADLQTAKQLLSALA